MKSIVKNFYFIFLLLALPIIISAQIFKITIPLDDKVAAKLAESRLKNYEAKADAFRKEVWGWDKAAFNLRKTPQEYSTASKVIIAKHFDIKTSEFKSLDERLVIVTEIERELISINDKSALTKHSEISFTKYDYNDNATAKNTIAYIGVKVIKPDGSEKEISSKDVVLTKDNEYLKEAKVAIPDLQVGDMVDYFIAKEYYQLRINKGYTLSFFNVSPVLNYSFRAEISDKYAIEFRSYNGAPPLKVSKSKDGSNVLEFTVINVPAYPELNFWVSPDRQFPIIRMNLVNEYKGLLAKRYNPRESGQVYQYQNSDEFIEDMKNNIRDRKFASRGRVLGLDYSYVPVIAYDYYKDLMKNKDKLPPDSLAAELYYIYRFNFLVINPSDKIDDILKSNYFSLDRNRHTYELGVFLRYAGIVNHLVFVTPFNGPELKDIMNKGEINYLLSMPDPKQRFFGVENIFTPAFFIPFQYENNQKAVTLDTKGRQTYKLEDFDYGTVDVPVTLASENLRIEKLAVMLDINKENLDIDRHTTLKGHYKSDEQKRLILFEDYINSEMRMLGVKETIIQWFVDWKQTKKLGEELKIAFDNVRRNHKDAFVSEAKDWFEQEVSELYGYKVENTGVRHTNPDFIYSSKFKIGGLVKKAGNNLIIEVGKLQGSPLKVNNDQRKRTLDVYAPFARSFQFNITLQIPEGYTVEGLASLNKKIENETGYFIAEASSDDKQITIHVKKSYHHSFEPAANWDKLLAFIDAANDWTNARILLKKK